MSDYCDFCESEISGEGHEAAEVINIDGELIPQDYILCDDCYEQCS